MVLVVLLMGTALALNRLSPAIALATAWVGALLQMYAGAEPDLANLAILVVLYSTARHGEPLVKWAGLASAGLGALVIAFYLMFRPGCCAIAPGFVLDTPDVLVRLAGISLAGFALLGLSWTVGLLVRTWTAANDARRDKVVAEETVVVEQERNRIARDMHDVVAHSLAVVIAQADGARYAAGRDPGAVDQALGTIAATAREALGDVRLLLARLRHDEDEGPQPMLVDLDRLLEQFRSAGLTVDFEERGTALALPPGQQLAVYRIVQEALTNALRHGAGVSTAQVGFGWNPDELAVSISNPLSEALESDGAELGHGIPGMRERAALVGGELTAAEEDGAFVVRARIPAPAGAIA